jgi:hypothetical protein
MNHELHPTRLVEKPLEQNLLARRNHADGGFLGRNIPHCLSGDFRVAAGGLLEPGGRLG